MKKQLADRFVMPWIETWAQVGIYERMGIPTPRSLLESDEANFALAMLATDSALLKKALEPLPRANALLRRITCVETRSQGSHAATDVELEGLAQDAVARVSALTRCRIGDPQVVGLAERRPTEAKLLAHILLEWMDVAVGDLPLEHQAAYAFLGEQLYALRDSFEVAGWVSWVYFEQCAAKDPWQPLFELHCAGARLFLSHDGDCTVVRLP